VVSEEWAARSVASLVEMREMGYGYLWWVKDYPYRDRTVRAFYAGGNGGQLVIGVPELDLLVTFYGGNYQDRVQHRLRDELVPRYILPAVDGGG
jgi:CubicO group peptidase (beta-lactamase class C family)